MSVNWALAVGAVFVASMGTIAEACKRPRAQEMSATPNNSVRNNTVGAFSSNEIISPRKLGAELAAC
jgi:hypothetical protein